MFAVKYALSKVYHHPLASIATIVLVVLVSATIMLATSAASSLQLAENKTLAPLSNLGADIVMVRQASNEEPGYYVGDLPDGVHKNGNSVYFKKHEEDKEYITDTFASLGVPIGIAGKFNADELIHIDNLDKISTKASLLLASYCYTSQEQKKVIIPGEDIRPRTFRLDPKEEMDLEQKVEADSKYKQLKSEQQQLMNKPEWEWTEADVQRERELSGKLENRKMELYHQLRPDVFDAPPKRAKKEIEPPPPKVVSRDYNIAGMEPGVGYLKDTDITNGRYFTNRDREAKVAILRADFARKNNLSVGDVFKLLDTEYRVIGIGWPSLAANAPEVYVPLAALQEQLNAKGVVNMVFIKTRSGTDVDFVKRELAKLFPDAQLSDNSELGKIIKPSVKGSAAVLAKFNKVLSLLLLAAAIGIISLLGFSSAGKRAKEIATLSAMGWPKRKVGFYLTIDIAFKVAFGVAIGLILSAVLAGLFGGNASAIPDYRMYGSSNFFSYLAGHASAGQLATVNISLDLTPSILSLAKAIGAAVLVAVSSSLVVVRQVQSIKPAVVLRRP